METRATQACAGGRARAAWLGALLALPPAVEAHGWGFGAHRLVNERAVATLPPELRPLFDGNRRYLAEHSIDPDLWRAAGQADEGPNHYLDLDAFGAPPFDVPTDESEHLRRHGAEARQKGRVPWRVAEVYRELVTAFARSDEAAALRLAAVLGHYVSDAHVPLHAALNYDGQLSGQRGLHARWEDDLFDRYQRQLEPQVRPGPARRLGDPATELLAVLRRSFDHSLELLRSDLECRGAHDYAATAADERYDDFYYSKMYVREERRLVERLNGSAEVVGSFWLSAWEQAGRPVLDASFRFRRVRRQQRAVLLSLDGASARALDAAVSRGALPHLARLRARGARSGEVLPPLPAKTAPGHAALYTGAWPERNGVAANEQLRPGGSLLELESGFLSSTLQAEPLWVSAARQGLRATVVSTPQSAPFGPYLSERRFGADYGRALTLINGYQNRWGTGDLLWGEEPPALVEPQGWAALPQHRGTPRELDLSRGELTLAGLLYDDPDDPAAGFDTLLVRTAKARPEGATLKPRPAGAGLEAFGRLVLSLPGGRAALFLRLFELSPDGTRLLLYGSQPASLKAHPAAIENTLLEETGGFVGNSAVSLYAEGRLGPTLAAGGDGSAERRYLETLALSLRQFQRLAEFARARTPWELLVLYVPFPDDFFHLWWGYFAGPLPPREQALAAQLQPHFDQALELLDGYLGTLLASLDPDTLVALAADHGHERTRRLVRPNVVLREAGLLATRAGALDLAGTQALYLPNNSGFVALNRAARSGGTLAPAAAPEVARRVRQALMALRDESGREVVLDVLDARRQPRPEGLAGEAAGDLYLSLAPDVYAGAELTGAAVVETAPRSEHALDRARPGMASAFLVAGPGAAEGVELGPLRAIDVAPTLSALLGLDPPASAAGKVIEAALAPGPGPELRPAP